MESLLVTVRREIGECIRASFQSIPVAGAQKMLMLDDRSEALQLLDSLVSH